MNMFITKLISSVIQIILFAVIPFIWWAIFARKEIGFLEWIGIKKIKETGDNKTLIWICVTVLCFFILSTFILISIKDNETATSDFSGIGINALPAIFIYAVLNTALPEELLFRGFLLKRIMNKFGFTIGNLIQSTLFGLIHGIIFISAVGLLKTILIILFTGSVGWLMGYINEKKAGGSILPSLSIHSLANIFSGVCSAFLII